MAHSSKQHFFRIHWPIVVSVVMGMAMLFFAGRSTLDYRVRIRVAQTRHDLKLLGEVVEHFYVDYTGYLIPEQCFKPGSIYFQRLQEPAWRPHPDAELIRLIEQVPMERRRAKFKMLDVPPLTVDDQAVLDKIREIESAKQAANPSYDAGTFEMERNRWDEGFLTEYWRKPLPFQDPFSRNTTDHYRYGQIIQRGCRRFYLDAPYILMGNGPDGDADIDPALIDTASSGTRVIYDRYPFQGIHRPLSDLTYDPTNGQRSNGDIVWIKP